MKKILTAVFSLIISGSMAGAQPATNAAPDNLDDLNKNELLGANPLGEQSDLIKKFQHIQGTHLLNQKVMSAGGRTQMMFKDVEGVLVERTRHGEVLVITIPASHLFMPNKTELRADAGRLLIPFLRYLTNPDMYWVILDMHADNTGSEAYTDRLTLDRVNSVFNWFMEQGADTRFLFPTASGASDPLPGHDNESMADRAANRRLEIYLVPGRKMLEQAKKGKIEF